ncbi:MAG: DNA repair protein RadC [Gammaproteobacteria bacterium]|nr:DNA repair protein RadC [Gammaproteobacteria bacterium]
MNRFVASENTGEYVVEGTVSVNEIVRMAKQLLNRRFAKGKVLSAPKDSIDFLKLKLSHLEHEVFSLIFLDNTHKIIQYEEMFRGTIDSSSVYPREVVKRALQLNTAAVIFAHNHPSGNPEPSQSDELITQRLVEALKLMDIRVLDHIVIGGDQNVSMAERGMI